MSDDLIAFYRARLDETEAAAHASGPARVGWATYRDADGGMLYTSPVAELGEGWAKTTDPLEREWVTGGQETHPTSVHVVYDPADVLADVEGMRHLVWLYERDRSLYEEAKATREAAGERGSSDDEEHFYTGFDAMRQAVQCAAARYRTHPDYQWKWAIGIVSPDELRAMQARDSEDKAS